MALMPGAIWKPVGPHATGGMSEVMGVSLHHAVSNEASAFASFQTGRANSHFFVEYDGTIYQYVDTANRSWAQCAGNTGWITIENESPSSGDLWISLTPEQVHACGRILRWAHDVHGVPMQLTEDRNVKGLAYHSMVPGPCETHWGQTGCPGPKIVAQRPDIIASALGAPPPAPEPDWEEIELMAAKDEILSTLSQWEQDTRKVVTEAILTRLGEWEQDTRKQIIQHIDRKFAELEAKLP